VSKQEGIMTHIGVRPGASMQITPVTISAGTDPVVTFLTRDLPLG
jgi:hypothetical protein